MVKNMSKTGLNSCHLNKDRSNFDPPFFIGHEKVSKSVFLGRKSAEIERNASATYQSGCSFSRFLLWSRGHVISINEIF